MKALKLSKIGMIGTVLGVLSGCADYNTIVDKGFTYACGIEGKSIREGFRATRSAEYVAKDRAIGTRCPGEESMGFTGNPFPNGISQDLIDKYGVTPE